MNKKLKLILFDLDGTLIETVHEIADATNDTLRALNQSSVADCSIQNFSGSLTERAYIASYCGELISACWMTSGEGGKVRPACCKDSVEMAV